MHSYDDWLLHRHAVQRTEAEHQISTVNADDFARGKQLCERVERDAVVRIVERGNQHQAVGDVEIRVAGRQPLAVEVDRRGHGERDHAQAGALQQLQIFPQRFVVRFDDLVDDGHHGFLIHEARQIVDVTVRVVARDALLQPDGPANPEIIGEVSLQIRASEAGITHLHGFAQQAFFGGQQETGAVDIDAAAFEHDARLETGASP